MDEKEIIEKIQKIIDSKTNGMIKSYSEFQDIFESFYNLPELDPLRYEICLCIMFGLHQATITLTNHLMEKFLKLFLAYHYSTTEDKKNLNKDVKQDVKEKGIVNSIIDHFKEGIDKYKDINLYDSINLACKKGIITKEQKDILHKHRENFRNAFSHADSQKTFGDSSLPVTGLGLDEGKITSEAEKVQKVFDLPMIQGLMQVKIAEMTALPFFKDVDTILRHAKTIVIPSSDKDITAT